jgi:hypothetical protein
MTSGLSSPSRPWFTLKLPDDDLMEDPEVKAWLDIVQKRMESFFAATNFYSAVKTGYLELGLFGTEACVMLEHDQGRGLPSAHLRRILDRPRLGARSRGAVSRCPMTVIQAIQRFGLANVSERIRTAYDRSSYDESASSTTRSSAMTSRSRAMPTGAASRGARSIGTSGHDDQPGRASRGYQEQAILGAALGHDRRRCLGAGARATTRCQTFASCSCRPSARARRPTCTSGREMVTDARVKLRRQPKSVVPPRASTWTKVAVPYEVPYQAIEAIGRPRAPARSDQPGDLCRPVHGDHQHAGHPAPQHRGDRLAQRGEADPARAGDRAGQQREARGGDRPRLRHLRAHRPVPARAGRGPAGRRPGQCRVRLDPHPDAAHGRARPDRAHDRLRRQCRRPRARGPAQDRLDGGRRRIFRSRRHAVQAHPPDQGGAAGRRGRGERAGAAAGGRDGGEGRAGAQGCRRGRAAG